MSIHVALKHTTIYRYDRQVELSPHVVRLRPAAHCRTPILAYSLDIAPDSHFINWQQDVFGNYLARLVFNEPVRELKVDVEVIADMKVINPFDFFLEDFAEELPFDYPASVRRDLTPYLECVEDTPAFQKFHAGLPKADAIRTVDWLVAMNQAVNQAVGYTIRLEAGVQSCDHTLTTGTGSCRDSAWLLTQAFRSMGMAARFVSGYLVQLTPDVKSTDGPSGPEKDFTDLHAWTEVYIPGAGWIGLDPTSGLFAGEGHIPLACTPEPRNAAPIEGLSGPCEVEFDFSNQVTRIHEDPRVTKPYTDTAWAEILALGDKVDADLDADDVGLTMGGEPTFVSKDNMEGEEWNTTADSPEKRELAHDLLLRLRERFAPDGVLHFGEGKWYPGESLPRWAFTLCWRKDGKPLWSRPDLLANPHESGTCDTDAAQTFLKTVAKKLKVDPDHVMTAHEDVAYHLWKEGGLPVDIDPADPRLKNSRERKHLLKLMESGLGDPVGHVLPVSPLATEPAWRSASWPLRRDHLFLVPGDSALGLRLPLDSIPWEDPADSPAPTEASPLEDTPELPAAGESELSPATDENKNWIPHTALCTEVRDGNLFVFLPPLKRAEDFLDLLHAIETTAAERNQPMILEGYAPPRDIRLEEMKITPDPGVIELNIHPSRSWRELVDKTEALYGDAEKSRLIAEKFMLDGRHTGTGGGNHIVLGGATPAESPFFKNPGLLRSLITYWQHHPGLSYLFSGMFIGPTSQAPRVDEGRDDRLHELEIAFSQLPSDATPPPWVVDRVLRNHLVDLTGNTHRAEFCIDKLYSPDSPTGRLGLVELRGFEMPPHARMSLLQQLLIRAVVAMFWKKPYHHAPTHWGTELHDRFMLPHFVKADLDEVVRDLKEAGFLFKSEWFDPFVEFRFPPHGMCQIDHLRMELRFAIEPWHVLGEESASTGTARYVDSSAERVQVKVQGLTDERHVVTCNGRRVPLTPTGTRGEYVAGIRYQAWAPWSALHPTLKPQSPLVFDVVDTWNGRSIGGCSYHVAHPGGRSYETFPVNAYEAESRRVSRFWQEGHTQGAVEMPTATDTAARSFTVTEGGQQPFDLDEPSVDPDFPCTFDLRTR